MERASATYSTSRLGGQALSSNLPVGQGGRIVTMQDYQDLGTSICETSRTPILGSDIPDGDIRKWFAWELAGQNADAVIATGAEGGLVGAGAALKLINRASAAATAVDAFCRWGRP